MADGRKVILTEQVKAEGHEYCAEKAAEFFKYNLSKKQLEDIMYVAFLAGANSSLTAVLERNNGR